TRCGHARSASPQDVQQPVRSDPRRYRVSVPARLLPGAVEEQAGRAREAEPGTRQESQRPGGTEPRGKRRTGARLEQPRYGTAAGQWKGSHVVICASGPSLTVEDLAAVRRWRGHVEVG